MSSVTFSPSVGGDGSTVTDDSSATTGLDGGGHRTRFVPALAQVVAVAANTVTKAGEVAASATAAAGSASSAADQVGLTTAAGAAQVALAAAHVATASAQATASATSAGEAAASASAASASATSAATSATSAGTAATAAANTLISAVTQRPALRPSLSVDWTLRPTAAALTAAGWTISRAGEMTYFGAVPVKVAENLFVRSQDFANAAWVNSAITVSAVTGPGGLAGSKLVATAVAGSHRLLTSCTNLNLGSTTYRLRFLCKAAEYSKFQISDNSNARARAQYDLATGEIIGTGSGPGYISHSVTPHELGGGLYWCELVMTSLPAGSGWAPTIAGYPDGATLNSGGAEYTGDGTSGIEVYAAQLQHNFDGDYVPTTDVPITRYASPLLTAAANELAYQHNSRGECVGLLQYPSDTNLCLQSQALSTSPWAGVGIAVAMSKRLWAGSAPFWRISKTVTTASRSLRQVPMLSIAAGTRYTASLALLGDRWSSTTSAQVGVFGVDNTDWGSSVDSTAAIISGPGTLAQSNGSLFTVSGLSYDTPTLVRITRNYPLAETRTGVYIYPDGSTSTTLGAAILATRVHLSASQRYMPYIPTTTAAVTRGAQSITLSGSAFAAVNNPVEGTLLARASVEDLVWDGQKRVMLVQHSGGSGNFHMLSTEGTTSGGLATTFTSSISQFYMASGTLGQSSKTVAYSYSGNRFQSANSGVLSTLDNNGTVPVVDQLVVGLGGSLSWVGLIQRTELYPRAMTSAELAAITTPGVLV